MSAIPPDLIHIVVTYCQDALSRYGIKNQKFYLDKNVIVCLGYGKKGSIQGKIAGAVKDGCYPIKLTTFNSSKNEKGEIQYFPSWIIINADISSFPLGTPVTAKRNNNEFEENFFILASSLFNSYRLRFPNSTQEVTVSADKITVCPMGHLPYLRKEYNYHDVSLSQKIVMDSVYSIRLGYYLQYNSWVEKLNLSKNSIGTPGMYAISTALLTNTTLSRLILDENNIWRSWIRRFF